MKIFTATIVVVGVAAGMFLLGRHTASAAKAPPQCKTALQALALMNRPIRQTNDDWSYAISSTGLQFRIPPTWDDSHRAPAQAVVNRSRVVDADMRHLRRRTDFISEYVQACQAGYGG